MERDQFFDELRHLNFSNGLDYGENFVHLVNIYDLATCDDAECRKRALVRIERGDIECAHCVEDVRKRILLAIDRRVKEMGALALRLNEYGH